MKNTILLKEMKSILVNKDRAFNYFKENIKGHLELRATHKVCNRELGFEAKRYSSSKSKDIKRRVNKNEYLIFLQFRKLMKEFGRY